MKKVMRALVALALGVLATLASGQERVSFPSYDGAGNAPVVLSGYFFPASASPAPAIAMFHGCGGAYDKSGALARRMREYAELFNGIGLHVLVVDSLTARYEKELCTQRSGTRRVTQANRRLDALGALAYLADRADVDAKRIGLIGWSNGGSTVLSATNLHHRDVAAATVKPAFAIAFYPGCEADLKRGYSPSAPLLMLVGQIDDWTPSAPCVALARSVSEMRPEIVVYPGAGHGFDSDAPVRLRKDVPNGANPGQGVHVGGNPAAWRASRDRVVRFLAEH
ncbi:MAG TPA: dienelactone hydrolase family protein [Caldimonas sp.]|jgi:dienelactone hydrolase|nr:dienelactone hydrolase family protein [Caldimonas sp.]HEV7575929.1 dienelactone hydrolase family protein [Caldimonas sp.]